MKILEEEEVGEGIKCSLLGLKFEVIMREPSEDVRRLSRGTDAWRSGDIGPRPANSGVVFIIVLSATWDRNRTPSGFKNNESYWFT